MHSYFPQTRQHGLKIQELPDEILIFDTENDQANCLNAAAALVWKNADGTRSVPEIAARVGQTLHTPVDDRVVWYALQQLSQRKLLENGAQIPSEYVKMSRRAFLIKAGIIGAAVAVPVIISIVAPTPAHAQSGCFSNGVSCVDALQCCSLCCNPSNLCDAINNCEA